MRTQGDLPGYGADIRMIDAAHAETTFQVRQSATPSASSTRPAVVPGRRLSAD